MYIYIQRKVKLASTAVRYWLNDINNINFTTREFVMRIFSELFIAAHLNFLRTQLRRFKHMTYCLFYHVADCLLNVISKKLLNVTKYESPLNVVL